MQISSYYFLVHFSLYAIQTLIVDRRICETISTHTAYILALSEPHTRCLPGTGQYQNAGYG